jgi:hypothetical protein
MRYEMPALTEKQRDQAIKDCKADIAEGERRLEQWNLGSVSHTYLLMAITRQQIALAALTAEPEPCDDCNGSGYAQEVGCDALGSGCGSCCGTGKSISYLALPVTELKPIKLPSVHVDNPINGFYYRCDEVVTAIQAAGYEVKE